MESMNLEVDFFAIPLAIEDDCEGDGYHGEEVGYTPHTRKIDYSHHRDKRDRKERKRR